MIGKASSTFSVERLLYQPEYQDEILQYFLFLVHPTVCCRMQWRIKLCLIVPVGKGWLGAPLIKKDLRKVKKNRSAQNARALRRLVQGPL